MTEFQGGCLCGPIRYRASAAPFDETYCHCGLCRRAGGAPVVAWASFPAQQFSFTRGQPVRFESSKLACREFCARCGTQLTFRYVASPDTIDVTIASLDDPAVIRPKDHVWYGSRIHWFDTRDELPRFPEHRSGG